MPGSIIDGVNKIAAGLPPVAELADAAELEFITLDASELPALETLVDDAAELMSDEFVDEALINEELDDVVDKELADETDELLTGYWTGNSGFP